MIGYKDMTFCKYWKKCKLGDDCRRALTDDVIKSAEKWWGGEYPPITMFSDKPPCFVKKVVKK